jgi:hypothetical protein
MFSTDVVDDDRFLDMSAPTRLLYYDLGMRADDDGFISPKKVMRLTSASDDDLKVLIGKGFVIPFDSGVIVIKDWKMNNYIQKDRYTETIYKEEKRQLSLDSNDSYILDTQCIQNVSKMDTQVRLGKVRLGNRIPKGMVDEPPGYEQSSVTKLQTALKEKYPIPLTGITDRKRLYNVIQVLSPRKGTDEWMDSDWKKNLVSFMNTYLSSTREEYFARGVDSLKEKIKLWREYRGKLN